jgi:hypothetical protein
MLNWDSLSRQELQEMWSAGEQVLNCYRVLAKSSDNIVGEIIKGQGTFYEMDHYPPGDIYDPETHCQYYYHAHRGGEHGHFHTFLRSEGMPDEMTPIKGQSHQDYMDQREDNLTHLIAISMDPQGFPMSLFTTNRWVTAENWYDASDVTTALDRFEMDLVPPSWPVNIWMTNLVRLYAPVIRQLLTERDITIANWAEQHPERDVFEDRELEVTSEVPINVVTYLGEIEQRLK